MKENYFLKFEKAISTVGYIISCIDNCCCHCHGEGIINMIMHVIPLNNVSELTLLIDEIATLFILLEVILMLLRYIKEGHHIPVRYLIFNQYYRHPARAITGSRKRDEFFCYYLSRFWFWWVSYSFWKGQGLS